MADPKMTNSQEEALAFVVKAKEQYRIDARSLSWEEKVASIERMREAASKAREGMRATLLQQNK